MSMTKETLIQEIHKIYQQDTDYPDSTDDDYKVMETYADMAVNLWEQEVNIKWRELFDTHSFTTVDETATYDMPDDFNYPSGYLRIGTDYLFPYIPAEKNHLYESRTDKRYYITGTKGDYQATIAPTPTDDNGLAALTAYLDYYKAATAVSAMSDSDEIEMADPWYIIHFVAAKLFAVDEDTTQASIHMQIADDKLEAMRIKNESPPDYQSESIDLSDGFGV